MNVTIKKGNYSYACCIDCEKRTVGCHAKCPEYLEVRANNERLKEEKIRPYVEATEAYMDIQKRKDKKRRKWR